MTTQNDVILQGKVNYVSEVKESRAGNRYGNIILWAGGKDKNAVSVSITFFGGKTVYLNHPQKAIQKSDHVKIWGRLSTIPNENGGIYNNVVCEAVKIIPPYENQGQQQTNYSEPEVSGDQSDGFDADNTSNAIIWDS